jgi:hypothetical protein
VPYQAPVHRIRDVHDQKHHEYVSECLCHRTAIVPPGAPRRKGPRRAAARRPACAPRARPALEPQPTTAATIPRFAAPEHLLGLNRSGRRSHDRAPDRGRRGCPAAEPLAGLPRGVREGQFPGRHRRSRSVRKQAFRSAPTRPVSGRGPGAQPSCQKTPPFPRFRHSRRRPLRPQGSRPPRGRGPLPQGTGCEPPNQSPEPPAPGEARCLLANAGARALERHSRAGRRLPPKEA